jgi:MoxR-like ATPase
MSYTPIFSTQSLANNKITASTSTPGDCAPSEIYVYTDEITLALNVALATGRPLLVRGTSGSGKTSLARSVAAQLNCGYREAVITARTQARDLMWTTDLLKRLQDSQTGSLSDDWRSYVVPGALWWAFDPSSAKNQYLRSNPKSESAELNLPNQRTVLLIDEIDKADPDVPNSLLRPIGDLAFEVEETGQRVVAQLPAPLIVITTNEERDIPVAFLRRCVELNMPTFDKIRLMNIGRAHFPDAAEDLITSASELVLTTSHMRDRREPNPAEYLDVLRACNELGITPSSTVFRQLVGIALGTGTL